MNKGFTLIELLVVVLIIGILASIALPQYTKAVERARMSEAVQVLGDLATAQSIYFMQHNTFANGFGDTSNAAAGTLNSGDIVIADPSAAGSKWVFSVTGDGDLATMTATRDAGMYKTGVLQITVEPSGAINKTCTPPTGKADFCTLAQTAGYQAS